MIAQDYHPYEYLFLHTAENTLRAFEQKLSGIPDCERKENRSYTPENVQKMLENGEIPTEDWAEYQNIPYWAYDMIRNYAKIDDDLSQAVLYQHGRNGAVINYESGLLTVWG